MTKKNELDIKNKIKVLRAEMDITQEGLAKAVGVTRATINAVEKCKYTPSLDLAFKLSIFFKTDIHNIFSINDKDN